MGTYIIAEAGVNHNGNFERAMEMVEVAADAGADAIKFQVFKSENLATYWAPKCDYLHETTDENVSQLELLQGLELKQDHYPKLLKRCQEREIDFLVTPFDLPGIDFLVSELGLGTLKLPSGEVTNGPYLLKAARSGAALLLSTGMSTLDEVEDALAVIAFGLSHPTGSPGTSDLADILSSPSVAETLCRRVSLFHCTSEYPAPFADANLSAIDTMKEKFNVNVGLSDHTPGIIIAVAAVARGASLIEKHFTLDKNLPGPDHQASLTVEELYDLVREIRIIESAVGDGNKVPQQSELGNRDLARRSLVAARPIKSGETFSENNIVAKRPGTGTSPMRQWDLIGTVAEQDYQIDDPVP